MNIIINDTLCLYDARRARTHRKRRTDKKWLKRYGYVTFIRKVPLCFRMGGTLIMSSVQKDRINKLIKNNTDKHVKRMTQMIEIERIKATIAAIGRELEK